MYCTTFLWFVWKFYGVDCTLKRKNLSSLLLSWIERRHRACVIPSYGTSQEHDNLYCILYDTLYHCRLHWTVPVQYLVMSISSSSRRPLALWVGRNKENRFATLIKSEQRKKEAKQLIDCKTQYGSKLVM